MKMGIDLGTCQVAIAVAGRGVVLREPSVIAVDRDTDKMIACGREAGEMLGKEPDSIRVIRPMTKGVISDYHYAERMLQHFVRRVCAYKILKPRASVCVPASVTEVEQRAVIEAALASGARSAVLIEEAVAAAIGAGLDVAAPRGCMIADLGGGTTDAAVLSLKGMASSLSVRVGGDDFDEAIVRYMHNRYNHVIGLPTAEMIKKTIGDAMPDAENNPELPVRGRDAVSGLPQVVKTTAMDIREAIHDPLEEIMSVLQRVLESTPPELVGDIYSNGLLLSGGLSQMKGMVRLAAQRTGVACRLAEHPEDCVALGTEKALKYVDILSTGVYDISRLSYRLSDVNV
ncbi:MAG: rod shape-determining protein [Clostridiales bacterium]|nr:rod shape-determining protein [Clostridiales bacterium]